MTWKTIERNEECNPEWGEFSPYPMEYGDMIWNGIHYSRDRMVKYSNEVGEWILIFRWPSYRCDIIRSPN